MAGIWKQKATGAALQAIDAAEVRRALAVLADPAHGLQLQRAPFRSDGFATFGGNDLKAAVAWVAGQDDATGLYYALNPVPAGLGHSLKAADVLARRWLLVDVDRNKAVQPDDPATDAEHEAARELALAVLDYLSDEGWPAPLLVDSGNGWHLLYRIDLANDAFSRVLLRDVLKALAARFDDERGSIGAECHDARRIAKLPGTRACRGRPSEERPWRPCRLLSVPEPLEVVSADQLKGLAERLRGKPQAPPQPPPQPETNGTPFKLRAGTSREREYARKALASQCSRMALAKRGELNATLYRSGALMGNFVPHLLDEETVYRQLLGAARQAGCDNEWKDDDTLRRAIQAGMETPRWPPGAHEANGQHKPESAGPAPGEPVIVWASEIAPKPIEWLWPLKLARGKLTTFAGQTDQGKTFVTCDIMARITRGGEWPDSKGECAPPGKVLFISGDDDADDTIVPRLIGLEADLGKVAFLHEKVQADWSLAVLATLDAALAAMGPDVELVVIDPPTSFMANIDDHKNTQLRSVLTPLKDWAKRQRVAVILITHVNKGGAGKVEALQRVMGGVAWVTGVRTAYMFVPDPNDPGRKLFCPMKNNLGPRGNALAYRIVKAADGIVRVEWLGEVDTTADEAMGIEKRPRQVLATEWLVDLFRQKLEWSSDEFWGSARAHNISRNAVFEARVKLNLPKPRKVQGQGGDVSWTWWVPPDWPPLKQGADDVPSGPKEPQTEETPDLPADW